MSADEKELAEAWEATAKKHLADAYRYQALLFNAWATIRGQQKGLKRQAQRIKRLRARLSVLEAAGKEQLPPGWCKARTDLVNRAPVGQMLSAGTHIARRVVCAAIRYGGCEGIMFLGPRHFDATMNALIMSWTHALSGPKEEGFIDQFGAFMSREEAHKVATEAGQIIRRCGGDDTRLFSENLY